MPARQSWNIVDFGACGDGAAKDTDAIQSAINACHVAGGGRVLCPPGVYLTGSLLLKSNVDLHLEQGSVLKGSPDMADYDPGYCAKYWDAVARAKPHGKIGRAHLICAVRERRVALTGLGAIDGNGPAFFGPVRRDGAAFSIPARRPSHMVAFYECEDIRIENLHLLHSPCYTLWPYACNRVMVDGVTVRNHPLTPNGDGINPDSCRDVLIRGCLVDTGDDAIAIKSMCMPECGITQACENVIVTGCVLRSRRIALRLGAEGDGPIRNVVLSDLVMEGLGGLTFNSVKRNLPGMSDMLHGTPIEHVRCSNITMNTINGPIVAKIDRGVRPPACIRDMVLQNVTAVSQYASVLYGLPDIPIQGIALKDMQLTICGAMGEKYYSGAVPEFLHFEGGSSVRREIPHAFYGRYLRDVSMQNVRVEWKDAAGPWRSAVRFDDVVNVELDGVEAAPAPANPDGAAALLAGIHGARVTHCRNASNRGCFLGLEEGSDGVCLHGNIPMHGKGVFCKRGQGTPQPNACEA